MMMAKGKLIALAGAALAVLLVSSAAQADPAGLVFRAGGILVDGTTAAAGNGIARVTVPDTDADTDTNPDGVPGLRIRFFVDEFEVPCDEQAATTGPDGIARCGLLAFLPQILEAGGYTVVFDGNEQITAKSDRGSLIWIEQAGGDIP